VKVSANPEGKHADHQLVVKHSCIVPATSCGRTAAWLSPF
jgi:hypothetical protein